MDFSIWSQISAGVFALLGVCLTVLAHASTQKRNHQFHLESDDAKRRVDRIKENNQAAMSRLMEMHLILSSIGRAFSQTNLDITWRAELSDIEYDRVYLEGCKEIDRLRMLITLYESSLIDRVEKISSEMNMFWGNFKSVLYLTAKGKTPDEISRETNFLLNSHKAAINIQSEITMAKNRLQMLADTYRVVV